MSNGNLFVIIDLKLETWRYSLFRGEDNVLLWVFQLCCAKGGRALCHGRWTTKYSQRQVTDRRRRHVFKDFRTANCTRCWILSIYLSELCWKHNGISRHLSCIKKLPECPLTTAHRKNVTFIGRTWTCTHFDGRVTGAPIVNKLFTLNILIFFII